MDEHHMDTDGGHDRAERRRELKKAFHKAAKACCEDTKSASRYVEMLEAYRAWKNAH